MSTNIRPYIADDFGICVQIFKSNIPKYFDESELQDFEEYLRSYALNSFWVVELDNTIVACGGIHIRQNGWGSLCYGIVDHSLHKKGIGTQLANFRLLKLLDHIDLTHVALDTSQHTYGFFERLGFKVINIQKDFFGIGLDCYSMEFIIPQNHTELAQIKNTIANNDLSPAP